MTQRPLPSQTKLNHAERIRFYVCCNVHDRTKCHDKIYLFLQYVDELQIRTANTHTNSLTYSLTLSLSLSLLNSCSCSCSGSRFHSRLAHLHMCHLLKIANSVVQMICHRSPLLFHAYPMHAQYPNALTALRNIQARHQINLRRFIFVLLQR